MKTLLFIFAVVIIIAACNNAATQTNAIKDFIPGEYVRHDTHEYGEEWDTLSISPTSQMANDYIIERKWAYQRVSDGVKQPIDYKIEKRKAIFDSEKMVLTETKSGRVISFVPEKNILLSETTEYKKIN